MTLRLRAILILPVCLAFCLSAVSCRKQPGNLPSGVIGTTADLYGEPGRLQDVDPFSGNSLNKALYVDFKGDRIYFCCQDSKTTFLSDPQFLYDLIRQRGIILEKAPRQ